MADFKRALAEAGVTELPPDRSSARTHSRDEGPKNLTREDFVAEAEQIRELAHGMREKLKVSKAKRKHRGPSSEEVIRKRVEKKFRARRGFLIHLLVYVAVIGIAFLDQIVSGGTGLGAFLDAVAPAQLWGIGLALHYISYYFGQGPGAEQRDLAIEREIRHESGLYGSDAEDDMRIRDRLAKKFRARRAIAMHAAVFLIFGLPMFVFDLFGSARADQIATVGVWGLLLGLQCWRYFYKHGRGAESREAEIEGEITRQLRLSQIREEERRRRLYDEEEEVYDLDGLEGRGVRLTDEGELTDSFVDEAARDESGPR